MVNLVAPTPNPAIIAAIGTTPTIAAAVYLAPTTDSVVGIVDNANPVPI